MLRVHKEFTKPVQLGLKQVFQKAKHTFPGLNDATALQEYKKLMDKVYNHTTGETVRQWAMQAEAICNVLIEVHTIRAN